MRALGFLLAGFGLAASIAGCGASAPDEGEAASRVDVPECVEAEGGRVPGLLQDETGTASVTVEGSGCTRTFTLSSTAERRDNVPDGPRRVSETAGAPTLHTGNTLFDALYQLALDDARQGSVDQISDGAFRHGGALPCGGGTPTAPPAGGPELATALKPGRGCFETGRKWTYVWTRDTSYSVDLGLAWVDPVRAGNSLDFKLSPRRDGSDLQIVQDTGTGGSYPVSTDRAVWSLGARELLNHLTGAARTAFAARALEAIKNTAAHDRAVVFDPADGLYRGEQSFLDWREQTYPGWAVPDLAQIGSSKSLSTNATHLSLLQTGSELADELGDAATARELSTRAKALQEAMRRRLWLPEDEQFSTYVTTDLDSAPARRFDLLGTSLAVLLDVATADQGRAAIASYPTFPKGPPVVFPQQQQTAIYHNRAIWPFVTAYWVKAARKVGNDAAFDAGVASLVRGAALNLSNMENLELVSGKPWLEDGPHSGPVVNSQRQLWSVAGYVGMVNSALFGVEAKRDGLHIAPFVTRGLRRTLFPASGSLALDNLTFHGKRLTVVVRLPDDAAEPQQGGAYAVQRVRLNGRSVADGRITDDQLSAKNLIEVELGEAAAPAMVRRVTDTSDYRVLYAPRTPSVPYVRETRGQLEIGIDTAGEDALVDVYRDGERVAVALPASTRSWRDPATQGASSPSHCYTVETRFASTGTVSQRARPTCFWGNGAERVRSLPASGFTAQGGRFTTAYGRSFQELWGDPGHALEVTFTAERSGQHLLQAVYGNGAGGLNTGITCAIKRAIVEEASTGKQVGGGYLVMPQRGDWSTWGDSSFVRASLARGQAYRVRIVDDAHSANMSALAHFSEYTGGTGGTSGPFGRVNIAELKLLSLEP